MFSLTRYLCYVGGASASHSSSSGGGGDCRSSPKLIDAFHPVFQRSHWAFDHVVIDVSTLISSVAYLTRDYVGLERDLETIKHVQRHLHTIVLRRLLPRKSLALLFNGSEPLWQLERTRLFPGRRYDSTFYRSAASPMVYLLEEKLRAALLEMRNSNSSSSMMHHHSNSGAAAASGNIPPEVLISGPATPGLSEGKVAAYLLDLATRTLQPPTNPSNINTAVTANDTFCVVGAPELAVLGLGVTPFHNITTVTVQQGEVLSCSLQETMEWLRLGALLNTESTTQSHGGGDSAATAAAATPVAGQAHAVAAVSKGDGDVARQRRLAAVRTDVVFLYLLTHGHATTGLPQMLSPAFAEVMDVYARLEEEFYEQNHRCGTTDTATHDNTQKKVREEEDEEHGPRFRSLLFDEEPITLRRLDQPALRLRVRALHKLVLHLFRHTAGSATAAPPSGAKSAPLVATLLTMALQTHGLLCGGGVPSPEWSPTPDTPATAVSASSGVAGATALMDKYSKVSLEQLLQHLNALLSTPVAGKSAAGPSPSSQPEIYLNPPRSRAFGLTGVEALFMTATQPEQIHQLLPVYARGHTVPKEVAADIVSTRNVHAALRKTRQVLGGVMAEAAREMSALAASPKSLLRSQQQQQARKDDGSWHPHPALLHLPSHLFVRTAGSHGPPAGWAYYGVHLGIKAEAMNVRYSINASDTATLRVIDASGYHQRDSLFVYVPASSSSPSSTSEDRLPMAEVKDEGEQKEKEGSVGAASIGGSWQRVPCHAALDTSSSNSSGRSGVDGPAGEAFDGAAADEAPAPISTLRVVTWNTQFSLYSGAETPLGRAGIDWCTPTRYAAAAKILEAAQADVVCLQEAEGQWAAYLAAQPWVQQHYVMTSASADSMALQPHGVLFLVRRGIGRVLHVRHVNNPGRSGFASIMPELTLAVGRGVAPIVLGGLHLLAPYKEDNESGRTIQLETLERHLQTRKWDVTTSATTTTATTSIGEKVMADAGAEASTVNDAAAETPVQGTNSHAALSHIIMGDFNDSPAKPYRMPAALGYKDAWEVLHPSCLRPSATSDERGYTIDGVANAYTAKIIEPRFYGRPDRILFQSSQLQPISAELIGTTRVVDVLPADAEGRHWQVDKPTEAVPDYLYPSDHFGVLVEFQIV